MNQSTLLRDLIESPTTIADVVIANYNSGDLTESEVRQCFVALCQHRLFDIANTIFSALTFTLITPSLCIEAAEVAFHQGNFQLAQERLERIPMTDRDRVDYVLISYRVGVRIEPNNSALVLIEKASIDHPENPWVQFYYAESALYKHAPEIFIYRNLISFAKWPDHKIFLEAIVRHTFAERQWFLAILFDAILENFNTKESGQKLIQIDQLTNTVLSTPIILGDSYNKISSTLASRLREMAARPREIYQPYDRTAALVGLLILASEFLTSLDQGHFAAAATELAQIQRCCEEIPLAPVCGAALLAATRFAIASKFNNRVEIGPSAYKLADISIKLLSCSVKVNHSLSPLYPHEFVGILHELTTGMLWFCDRSKIDDLKQAASVILALVHNGSATSDIKGLYSPAISRHSKKLALLLSGQIRGTTKASESIINTVAGCDADIFLTCWDHSGFKTPTEEVGIAPLKRHLPEKLFNFLAESKLSNKESVLLFNSLKNFGTIFSNEIDPYVLAKKFSARKVYVEIERHFEEKFGPTIAQRAQIYGGVAENTTAMNSVKMIYMIEKSFQNMLIFEQTHGIHYDYIARVRPDLIMEGNFKFQNYIEMASQSDSIFLNAFNFNVPSDMIAIGRRASMATYHTVFTEWLEQDSRAFGAVPAPSAPHSRLRDLMLQKSIGFSLLPNCVIGFDGQYDFPLQIIVDALRADLETPSLDRDLRRIIESMLDVLSV